MKYLQDYMKLQKSEKEKTLNEKKTISFNDYSQKVQALQEKFELAEEQVQ